MKKIFTFVAAALTAISASATFHAFNGTTLTESMSLVNDEYAEVKVGNLTDTTNCEVFPISDYESYYTAENCALTSEERNKPTRTLTFCEHLFTHAAYLRTNKDPNTTAPEGESILKDDDMGRGTIHCITIVAEPKEDCKIAFYYMRGATKSFNCFDSYAGMALNPVKDSLLHTENVTNCEGGVNNNEFHLTTFELQKDHVYTFYTRGGTTQVYGFETIEGEEKGEVTETTYGYNGTAANTMDFIDGATLTMTGNAGKNFGAGGGAIDGITSAKNSNGVQITYVAPEGKCVGSVTFKAVTNDDATNAVLKEVNGETINDTVYSLKDYTNPQVYTYNFESPVNEFTFTYGTKQVCFIMTVNFVECGGEEDTPYLEFKVAADSELEGEGNDAKTGLVTLKGTTIEDKGAGYGMKLDSDEGKYVIVAFYNTIAAGAKIEVAFNAGSNPTAENHDGIRLLSDKATATGVVELTNKYLTMGDKKDVVTLEYTTTEAMDEFYIYRIAGSASMYFHSVKVYGEEEPKSEGLFNTDDTVKAVKVIENGNLVIIKNGVRYNAAGAKL